MDLPDLSELVIVKNSIVIVISILTSLFDIKLVTGTCVDIMMGSAMTRDLNDGYIVSPGYPMVLTEAMRVRCQLRKISYNPT